MSERAGRVPIVFLLAVVTTLATAVGALATNVVGSTDTTARYDYDHRDTVTSLAAARESTQAEKGQTPSATSKRPSYAHDPHAEFLRTIARLGNSRSAPQSILPKPSASNAKLQNVVNDLYKGTVNPSRVGTGTTADAVRNELATGLPTGDTFHIQKALQYSNALKSVLKQNLSYHDRLVAQSLLDDLQRALQGQP